MELRDQIQSTLGDAYTVERELGGGGMSHVFVAVEAALGRRIVVKILPPDAVAQVSGERFKREIRLAATLQHPHIVPLLSAGDAGGLPYYTMPFVKGESLRERLVKGGELSVNDTLHVLRDVASALAYAHGLLGPGGRSGQARSTRQEALAASLISRARSSSAPVDEPFANVLDFRGDRIWRARVYLDHAEGLRAAGLSEQAPADGN